MSESLMSQETYVRLESLQRPTPTPEQAIAAELAVALDHLAYVSHWATLDGAEQASLSTGIRILRELHSALTA